jgi:integrase
MRKGAGRGWFRRKGERLFFCWYSDVGCERARVLGDASMTDADGWMLVSRLGLDAEVGQPDPVNASFGDVLRAWLDYGKSKTGEEKAHSSLEGDRSRAKVHLIFWNDRVAKNIQPQEIQAWLDGKSVGIRSKLRNEMSAVYRHGQATGLIPRSAEYNPMSLVSAPTRSDFESVDLSPTECSAILEKIEEPMVRVLVVVVAVTGARASEVLGLRWADLDFKKGRIHIRRAWTHGKLGKPKSRLSRRPVPMVTGLAALMEAWRAETMYSSDTDFIFPSIKLGGRQPRSLLIFLSCGMVFATTTESQCYGLDFIRCATDWPPGWPIEECIRA